MIITSRIDKALNTSAVAHYKQFRKGNSSPYIVHPFAVAMIVSSYTKDEDTLIAALFHDTLEDVPDEYSKESMLKDFGENVVNIVLALSEDKFDDSGNKYPWEHRKKSYHAHLKSTNNKSVLLISAADKIHNLMSMIEDYRAHGEKLWNNFNATKDKQLWNYKEILSILNEKSLPDELISNLNNLVDEFESIVNS